VYSWVSLSARNGNFGILETSGVYDTVSDHFDLYITCIQCPKTLSDDNNWNIKRQMSSACWMHNNKSSKELDARFTRHKEEGLESRNMTVHPYLKVKFVMKRWSLLFSWCKKPKQRFLLQKSTQSADTMPCFLLFHVCVSNNAALPCTCTCPWSFST